LTRDLFGGVNLFGGINLFDGVNLFGGVNFQLEIFVFHAFSCFIFLNKNFF
jgi:hypothetical protein